MIVRKYIKSKIPSPRLGEVSPKGDGIFKKPYKMQKTRMNIHADFRNEKKKEEENYRKRSWQTLYAYIITAKYEEKKHNFIKYL